MVIPLVAVAILATVLIGETVGAMAASFSSSDFFLSSSSARFSSDLFFFIAS